MGKGTRLHTSVGGLQIPVNPKDYSAAMMLFGRYSPELVSILVRVLNSNDSVVDIGAQLGYISAVMALIVGKGGAVHSIEPDPRALELLEEVVRANSLSWVSLFPLAAANRTGKLMFNLSPVLGWSTAVTGSHLTDLITTEVDVTTVDALVEAGLIRRPVRLVKIDTEGYECAVLDGMSHLLEVDRPLLLVEVNPRMLRPLKPKDLFTRITDRRYRVYRIHRPPSWIFEKPAELVLMPEAPDDFCDILCIPSEMSLMRIDGNVGNRS
jgi:FkbM family methyltransferase